MKVENIVIESIFDMMVHDSFYNFSLNGLMRGFHLAYISIFMSYQISSSIFNLCKTYMYFEMLKCDVCLFVFTFKKKHLWAEQYTQESLWSWSHI